MRLCLKPYRSDACALLGTQTNLGNGVVSRNSRKASEVPDTKWVLTGCKLVTAAFRARHTCMQSKLKALQQYGLMHVHLQECCAALPIARRAPCFDHVHHVVVTWLHVLIALAILLCKPRSITRQQDLSLASALAFLAAGLARNCCNLARQLRAI